MDFFTAFLIEFLLIIWVALEHSENIKEGKDVGLTYLLFSVVLLVTVFTFFQFFTR